MSNIKFTQLPNLGAPTATTIIPVVDSGVNYTVTGANLQTYVTSTTGNITGGNILTGGLITATGNVTGGNILTAGIVSVTGNVTGSYFFGDGSQLTGLPATYGNANVAAYLPTFTGNLTANSISATGTITATANITMGNGIVGGNVLATGLISATGNVTGNYFIGNGSALTSITGASVTGTVANATYATTSGSATTATTVTGAAQANITSVGTLTSLSATGNIAGNYFVGNGSALTGIVATTTYNNANVAAFLPTYTGAMTAMLGDVTTTANVQGAYIKGNGSVLTGLVNSIQAGTGISVNAATGIVTITNNNPVAYTNSNVTSLLSAFGSNTVSTTGNITAGNYVGNGSALTGIVTSIIAGSGISVNAATGAVTVTATGGGSGGSSISNGTSNVTIPSSNGTVSINVAGSTKMSFLSGYASLNQQLNCLDVYAGNISASLINVSAIQSVSTASIATLTASAGTFGQSLVVPYNTATNTRVVVGSVGQIRAITDSPTNAGRMCYWCTTNSRWQYIDTNGAV